jgi:hypothetical protein
MLVGANGSRNITLHHNLFAHNWGRNPHIDTSGTVDVVNNVIYTPGPNAATVLGTYSKIPVNFVGNYAKHPLNNGDPLHLVKQINNNFGAAIYVQGNIDTERTQNNQDEDLVVDPEDQHFIVETRHPAPGVTTTSAFTAFDQVLAQAGATRGLNAQGQFFWRRDGVDERVVDETENGVGGLIEIPSDVGGWPILDPGTAYTDSDHDGMPDAWEQLHGFNPSSAADPHQDADNDGYTNLEEFLNGADPNSGVEPPPSSFIFVPIILKSS